MRDLYRLINFHYMSIPIPYFKNFLPIFNINKTKNKKCIIIGDNPNRSSLFQTITQLHDSVHTQYTKQYNNNYRWFNDVHSNSDHVHRLRPFIIGTDKPFNIDGRTREYADFIFIFKQPDILFRQPPYYIYTWAYISRAISNEDYTHLNRNMSTNTCVVVDKRTNQLYLHQL